MVVKKALLALLESAAVDGDLIPLTVYERVARKFSLTFKEIEEVVLENGLSPLRYQRQRKLISSRAQLRLLRSRVAVIGCGGLGGYVFEMLARLGVGNLVVIDPDFFVESNLNRQLLATTATLGRYKAEVARERAGEINPVVMVEPLKQTFQCDQGSQLLASCDLIFDALDSIPLRLELAALCAKLDLVLVHGAVSAWSGQVALVPPASSIMSKIYHLSASEIQGTDMGISGSVENLAPAVNLVAALEVAAGLSFLLENQQKCCSTGCFVDLLVPELVSWS